MARIIEPIDRRAALAVGFVLAPVEEPGHALAQFLDLSVIQQVAVNDHGQLVLVQNLHGDAVRRIPLGDTELVCGPNLHFLGRLRPAVDLAGGGVGPGHGLPTQNMGCLACHCHGAKVSLGVVAFSCWQWLPSRPTSLPVRSWCSPDFVNVRAGRDVAVDPDQYFSGGRHGFSLLSRRPRLSIPRCGFLQPRSQPWGFVGLATRPAQPRKSGPPKCCKAPLPRLSSNRP